MSALLHLRIPFSYFLMPVYFFALGISPNFNESRLFWSFAIIHLLLYPASIGINDFAIESLLHLRIIIPATLSTLLLLGSYPMTQVYQHEEDAKHGDKTMSMLLGIVGTFIFVQIVFAISAVGYFLYFKNFFDI